MPRLCARSKTVFWTSAGLIAYAHGGYPAVLGLLARGVLDRSARGRPRFRSSR